MGFALAGTKIFDIANGSRQGNGIRIWDQPCAERIAETPLAANQATPAAISGRIGIEGCRHLTSQEIIAA